MMTLVWLAIDEAKFFDSPEVHEFAGGEPACGKRNHQFRAAGNRRPLAGLSGDQIKHRWQRSGRDEFVFGWRHRACVSC